MLFPAKANNFLLLHLFPFLLNFIDFFCILQINVINVLFQITTGYTKIIIAKKAGERGDANSVSTRHFYNSFIGIYFRAFTFGANTGFKT